MGDRKSIPNSERLIFALDVPTADDALSLVDELDDAVEFFKIGLELFVASAGQRNLIAEIAGRGKKVMVDLKFFDVPETVGRAVARLADMDVTFATVHGNDGMLRAAAENKKDVKILAVTALTSLDEGDLSDLGFEVDVEKLVLSRARRAIEIGCDGVVSSGLEAAALRAAGGEAFLIVTPGIRPVENRSVDDQKRTVDVKTALQGGADYIVVGRPIRDAADRRAAALSIQAQISEVMG